MGIFKERNKEGLAYWVTVYGRGEVLGETLRADMYLMAQMSWAGAHYAGWLDKTFSGYKITDSGVAFAFEEET